MSGGGFHRAVTAGSWPQCIQILDAELLAQPSSDRRVSLLLNRGFCHLKLKLYRKASQVYRAPASI